MAKKSKFCIKDFFKKSFTLYKKKWKQFILIGVLFVVTSMLSGIGNIFNLETGEIIRTFLGDIMFLVSFIISTYLSIGVIRYFLNLVDGKKPKLDSVFHGVNSWRHLLYFIFVSFIVKALIMLGYVLFIIPGVVLSLGLVFANYYVAEDRGEVFESIKYSWDITNGYKWNLFVLFIILFVFNIIGLFAFVVGLIVTIPISSLVIVYAYRYLEIEFSKKH